MDHRPTENADAGSYPPTTIPDPSQATFDEKSHRESPLSTQKSNESLAIRDAPLEKRQEKAHVTQDDQIAEEETAKDGEALKKVRSKHSVRDSGSIPDGGLWAWLQVLGGFFLLFNSWLVEIHSVSLKPEKRNTFLDEHPTY